MNQSYQPISQPYFQGQCQEPAYAPTSLEPQRECQPQTIQYLDPLAFKELQKNVEELKNEIKKKSSSSTGKKLGFYDFTKKEEKERSPFPVRAPKFVPYDGTTDPQHHLVSFCNKCRAIADNDSMLINYFQESLTGDALTWYTSVPSHEINTFEDVVEKFLARYQHLTKNKPLWHDLANLKQKNNEDYEEFAVRWQNQFARSDCNMQEEEQVRMAISNMKDPMRALMTIGEVVSWSGLYRRLSRMKQNLDEGVLNTIIDHKKNTRRVGTTTQPESRTTPEVSLNQEEVYRPYQERTSVSFNQHQNPGQNGNPNFQGGNPNYQRNNQNYQRNNQNYRNPPRNNQSYDQPPRNQGPPVNQNQNPNPIQPVSNPIAPPQNQNANPQPNYSTVPFNYNRDNNGNQNNPNNGNRRRFGPKRANYPSLPQPWTAVFWSLLNQNALQLPPERPQAWSEHLDKTKFCAYHRMPGHDLTQCYTVRDLIYDLNDEGRIDWSNIRPIGGNDPRNAPPNQNPTTNPAQNIPNMQIYTNPLPQHGASTSGQGPQTQLINIAVIEHQHIDAPAQGSVNHSQPCHGDFFEEEDYRKYITPWDGKTKFKIFNSGMDTIVDSPDLYKVNFDEPNDRESPIITNSQPDPYPDTNASQAHLRSGRIRPPRLPPHPVSQNLDSQNPNIQVEEIVDERAYSSIEIGIEYDLLGHLTKIPAKVSVLDLIKTSPKHQQQLLEAITRLQVPVGITPEELRTSISALAPGASFPAITFTEEELKEIPPEARTSPLHLTVKIAGKEMSGALVDTGASLNICPLKTYKALGLTIKDLIPAPMVVTGYDGNKKTVCGKIMLLVQAGPISMPEEFYIMDIPATFNLILGRRWLNHMNAIMSSRHQCVKFPHLGKIMKLMGDPPVIEPEELQILPTLQPAPITPEVKIHGYKVDPLISLMDMDPVQNMFSELSSPQNQMFDNEGQARGWTLMKKMGYQPGFGLGKNGEGITDPYIPDPRARAEGLGYDTYNDIRYKQEDWTLNEHFMKHDKTLDPNAPPFGRGCHNLDPNDKGKTVLVEDWEDSTSSESETHEEIFGTWKELHSPKGVNNIDHTIDPRFQTLSCNMLNASELTHLPKKKRRSPKSEKVARRGKSKTLLAKKWYIGPLPGAIGEKTPLERTMKFGKLMTSMITKWYTAPPPGHASGEDPPQ